jgi:hypothetical protein
MTLFKYASDTEMEYVFFFKVICTKEIVREVCYKSIVELAGGTLPVCSTTRL